MTAQTTASKRKTTASRGEPVVQHVLEATMQELGRVGYRALRIEDVAARANVHKTTIYRRFPTKEDLVHAALQATFEESIPPPNTGSLRGDLLTVARSMLEFSVSPNGHALVRMMMTEGAEDGLRSIVDRLRTAKERGPEQIVERARARGELRDGLDGELLLTTLIGSLHHAIFVRCRPPQAVNVEALVDLLLYGATPR
jgi:AcrR family transcriptional regulator